MTLYEIRKKITLHCRLLLVLVIVASVLVYCIDTDLLRLPADLRTTVRFIFPLELFQPLKFAFMPRTTTQQVYMLPILTWVFCIFLFIAIRHFKNYSRSFGLRICLYTLLAGLAIGIASHVHNYSQAYKASGRFGYSPTDATGITKMIDQFMGNTRPDTRMVILHFLVLTLYILWTVYILRLVTRFERTVKAGMHRVK